MTLREEFEKEIDSENGNNLSSVESLFLKSDQYYIPWLEKKLLATHDRVAGVVLEEKGFRELSEWIVKNRRSVFNDADIPHESKRRIAFVLGYSDRIIHKP